MRKAALVLIFILLAGNPRVLADEPRLPHDSLWDLAALLGADQPRQPAAQPAAPVILVSAPSAEAGGLLTTLAAYLPAQTGIFPGLGHSKDDREMRTMVVSMGAMTGYMLAAMPLSLSGVVWAAAGGVVASYWYDNHR